jgi:hypothetical protein
MKHILALVMCCFALAASAQSLVYPYNPDSDSNGFINHEDLLDFLPLYGQEFEIIDSLAISNIDEVPDCLEDTTTWTGYIEPNCSMWGGLIELNATLARYITIESSCTPWGGGTLRITLPETAPCNGYVTTIIRPQGIPSFDIEGGNVPGNQDVDYAADFVFWNGSWYRKQ